MRAILIHWGTILFCVAVFSALSESGVAWAETAPEQPEEESTANLRPGYLIRFGRGLLLERIRTGSASEQVAAARELGRRRDRNAVPALIDLLEGAQVVPSGSTSEAIVQSLGEIGDDRAVPVLLGLLNGGGPLQRAAIRALGLLGDERALDPIANVLSRPSLTREAIAALLQLGPRVLMRVISLLRDPSTAGPACELLGQLGDRRATWPMVRALESPRARVRRQCAAALGHLGDPRAQRAIFRLLQDPDASVRSRALASLVTLADGSMGPILAPLVADPEFGLAVLPTLRGIAAKAAIPHIVRIVKAEKGSNQEEAIAALGRIGGPESAKALQPFLNSPRADLRFLVASSLAQIQPEFAKGPLLEAAVSNTAARVESLRALGDLYRPVPMIQPRKTPPAELHRLLQEALADPAPETAGAGAFLAGSIRDLDALEQLSNLSQRPSRPELRALAVSALGWLGTSKACRPIISAMSDAHEGVLASAAWAAGEAKCRAAGPTLTAILERGPEKAAGNAAWALGSVGYRHAISTLRRRLEEGGPALRANAALALAELDDPRASIVIRRRLGRERSERVQAAFIDALGQLGERASLNILERLMSLEGLPGQLARDSREAISDGRSLQPIRGSATFRARLIDHEGEPLPNIWFTMALPDRRLMGGLSDPSGEITIPGLPDGHCILGLGRVP